MIRRTTAALALALGLILGALIGAPPAQAFTDVTLSGSCTPDNGVHRLYVSQRVRYGPDTDTYFTTFTVSTRDGSGTTSSSLRNAAGTVLQGPVATSGAGGSWSWNAFVPRSLDPRVRAYYYLGVGCNVILNPPD